MTYLYFARLLLLTVLHKHPHKQALLRSFSIQNDLVLPEDQQLIQRYSAILLEYIYTHVYPQKCFKDFNASSTKKSLISNF